MGILPDYLFQGEGFGGPGGPQGLLDQIPDWLKRLQGGQQPPDASSAYAQAPMPQQVPMPRPSPFANQQPQQQPPMQGMPQRTPFGEAPKVDGLGNRLYEAVGGFFGNEGLIGGAANAIKTLATGEVTNPYALAKRQMIEEYQGLQRDFRLTEPQARAVMMNPQLKKEYSKAAVTPQTTVGPDGSFVQTGPFGKLHVAGSFPVSDRADVVNPDGSRSPGFAIRPSLSNPSGSLAQPAMGLPGGQLRQPGQRSPGVGSPTGGLAANDPTLSVSQRQILTEQSPAQKEEQVKTAGTFADAYKSARDKGAAATKQLSTLQRMSQLSDKAYEGAAAPVFQTVRSIMASFGIPAGSVPAGEEFTSLANKLVLDANNGTLGAGVSNTDVAFISAINPSLSHTAAGRKEIITTMTAIAKRDQQVAKMAEEWRMSRGTMAGFENAIAQWAQENPLFKGRENTATFADRMGTPAASGLPEGWTVKVK